MTKRTRRPLGMGLCLTLIAVAVGVAGLPRIAGAQNVDLRRVWDRLDRLERDIRTLNRHIATSPRGATSGTATGAAEETVAGRNPALAGIEVRLSTLEHDLRSITGRLEQSDHQLRQLEERLEKAVSDIEFRLSRIEQQSGLGTGAPPSPATASEAGQPPLPPAASAERGAPQGALGTMPRSEVEATGGQRRPAPPPTAAPTAGPTPSPGGLPEGTPHQQYAYAFGLLRKADYGSAEKVLREFIVVHPDDPLADNARYWLGETYYVRGDYVNAAETFLDAYQKNKKGPKAADALLKLGMSLARLDKKTEACTTFREIARAVPDAPVRIKKKVSVEKQRIGCR